MRLALAMALLASPAAAGGADVIGAEAVRMGAEWRVSATVRHADEGWDHYADAFEVVAPDGTVLGTRTLYHPHVEEQPFTRSLTLAIPEGVGTVTVRAKDSVHGMTGAPFTLELPR